MTEFKSGTVPALSARRKMLDWPELLEARRRCLSEGKTVVWTNGCFDLLHLGHVRNLQAARSFGQVLVVGLNSDSSVRHLKGPSRPVIPEAERAEILAALECVDYVIIFAEPTPENALKRLQPDVFCKGADYAPPHGRPIPEAPTVAQFGGRIEFIPLVPNLSTTDLVQRIRQLPEEGKR